MAVRTVEFKVSESGILPSSQQFGGVQGERRATCVSFTLEEDLFNKILDSANGNRVVYRFDAYDGAGGFKSTEPVDLTDGALEFYLEEWQTRFGGNVSVFLVITEIKDDSTEMELYSFPAVLRLKSRPEGEAVDGGNYESVSTLVESAKNSAKNALESAEAASESLDELLASVPDVDVLEVTDGVKITVTEKDEVSVAKVYNGKDGKDADLSLIANALKGSASGQGYAVAKDVSPLEHEVNVQLSGDSGGGEESVSQTATLNGVTRELLLDEPSSKVHVKFEQVDTYCDGAIVPLVDGEDLKAVAEVIVSPAYWYSEQLTLLDITYTITDSTLEWKGTYTSLTSTETEPEEISGSYILSSSGQKIIGFYQIYDKPEDNPDYSDGSVGNMENTLDIIVSVLANSFSGVAVTVGGKNHCPINSYELNGKVLSKVLFKGNLQGKVTVSWKQDFLQTGSAALFYLYNAETDKTLYLIADKESYGRQLTYSLTAGEWQFYLVNWAKNTGNLSEIQIETGDMFTGFESYKEPVTYTANADGSVDGVKSIYPSTSVSVEDASTVVNIEYNRDINKAFAELQAAVISLGGNV